MVQQLVLFSFSLSLFFLNYQEYIELSGKAGLNDVQDKPSPTAICIDFWKALRRMERDCDKLSLHKADLFENETNTTQKKKKKWLRACKISQTEQ